MSRCFPFPPPGYEKARIDNADFLKKEKQKEKKQKKDKEKREGKEKQDNGRSKEKHKDKRDRKEKHKDKDRERDKEMPRTSIEKKVEGQPRLSNGEKLGSNSLQNSDKKEKNSLYVQELAKRIRDEGGASGSQMVQKAVASDQRSGMVQKVVGRSISNQFEEKDKIRNKIEDYGKVNGQRNHTDARVLEKTFDQNFSALDNRVEKVAAVAKLEEKKEVEKHMEGKHKSKRKESDAKDDKLKDREREKNKKSKNKDWDKEEKKKAKEIIETSKQQPKLNENVSGAHEGGKDPLDFRNFISSELLSTVSSAAEGNLGKRKELERNGYLLDNGSGPNKIPRTVSSAHPVVENGKKQEPCQTAAELSCEQGLANNHRVAIKEQKINGLIAAHKPNVCSKKPSSAKIPGSESGETLSKAPHPDTKYLSQILSIPDIEEWSDANDQEWLLSNIHAEPKKPIMSSSWSEGTRQVWAEAYLIESADISALPYVIPY